MLGIKYVKYFPRLVYSLPGGLQIYRAVLKSDSPNQAVLGGPHKAWSRMLEMAQHMNPRAYLTAEARAWIVEDTWARLNQGKLSSLERFVLDEPAEEAAGRRITDGSASGGCTASVMRTLRILLVFIQPPGRRNDFGLWKIWARSLPTGVLIVEIAQDAETERSWRPLASRRRPSKP